MGASAKRTRVLVAVACLAAVVVVGEPGASASRSGGGSGSFAAGAQARVMPQASTPAITLTPTVTYPPNALCDALGLGQDSTVQVNGTKFNKGKAFKVTLASKQVASGTASATGTISATFEDPQQPFGNYVVTAATGRKSATATLGSSAQSCWSAQGTSGTPLAWNWSVSGFDAGTTTTLKVNGTAVQSMTTNSKGQASRTFNASCPVGPRPVTIVASIGGTVGEYPSGTANC